MTAAIMLHPPLPFAAHPLPFAAFSSPFSRCSNRDGEGGARRTDSPTAAGRTGAGRISMTAFQVYVEGDDDEPPPMPDRPAAEPPVTLETRTPF